MRTDVAIIGAGPAGLMASISSAKAGAKTAIIEANTSAGRKLLRTGRTRCNLTHTGSVEDFIRVYGPFGRFLRHSLYEFSSDDLRRYFAQHKLETKVEEGGCVFPVTDRATDVVRVLVDDARRLSVRFLYGKKIQSIEKNENGFVLLADSEKVIAGAVIIATGGVTWSHTGSTGDGYKFAQALGHTIVEPKACLTHLITAETWPGQLAGVGVGNVVITAKLDPCSCLPTGRCRGKLFAGGPMMFTHDGIGGPAVFDFSRLITDFLPNAAQPIKVTIDMLPAYEGQELDREIISLCAKNPQKELSGVLTRLLPHSLALNLSCRLNPSETILAGQLQKHQRRQLVEMLKKLPLSIKATGSIAEATVTRGGVPTTQINLKTMGSKLCPGLFFAGEVIDVDGPCGGFNLQIAFSTGCLAGKMAAEYVQQKK
jgi:predicted Rossmann fold flavoprotein